MRMLARVALLCNLAFLAAVYFRMSERTGDGAAIAWQPLQNTLVIMGYGAILINLLYLTLWLSRRIMQGNKTPVGILFILNAIFFFLQLIYFFVLP